MRNNRASETCPQPEEVISFAANPAASPDTERIFRHLLECGKCRESLAFAISANHAMSGAGVRHADGASEKDGASALSRGVALFLSRSPAKAAARAWASSEPDAIAAGIEPGDGRLYFRGGSGGPDDASWLAEVGVPEGEVAQDLLDVRVSCKIGGNDVFDGEFRLCGATAEIKDGEGRLSRETLAGSLAVGGVSFKPSGKRAIPGAPMFGGLQ